MTCSRLAESGVPRWECLRFQSAPIVRVTAGGAAERAGLRGGSERAYLGNMPIMVGGDLIVAIDGQQVQDQQQLAQMMNNHRAGDAVKVTIYRGKRKMDVDVTLGEA